MRAAPQSAASWQALVMHWVAVSGGWAPLCDQLLRRAQGAVDLPTDPATLEKGLRRLAARERGDGGQYGRWMLRFFGLPPVMTSWAKWLGQYHSRCSDLPVQLRVEQLQRWDQPPLSASDQAAWLHLGWASLYHRQQDEEAMTRRLELARSQAARAGVACELEAALFVARCASDRGDVEVAQDELARAGARLALLEDPIERLLYKARLHDQLAYQRLHPVEGPPQVEEALALFEAIEPCDEAPFVGCRKALGLAYCHWRLGDQARAQEEAREALAWAADAGLVRMRIIGLNLLAHILGEPEGAASRARARRLAEGLEDEELRLRVARGSSRREVDR